MCRVKGTVNVPVAPDFWVLKRNLIDWLQHCRDARFYWDLYRWGVNCGEPCSFGVPTKPTEFRVMNGEPRIIRSIKQLGFTAVRRLASALSDEA